MLTYSLSRTPRATRCAGATRPSAWPGSGRAQLGLEGAAFPWRTIRGEECSGYWPAGHRRLPRQRRHRQRGRATTCSATGDEDFARLLRARAAGRDGAAVAVARPPRRQRRLPHRRGHRPRRVHGDRRQQRLHQPRRAAEPARRRRPAPSALPKLAPAASASTRRRRPPGATPPTAMTIPYDEELGVHQQSEDFTDHARWDFESTPADALPAVPALPLLRHLPQAGGQAGRPGAGAGPVRRRVHRRGEGAQLRLLRAAHRPRLVALGLHPGGHRGRGRPPRPRLRLHDRGGADGPRRPRAQHPRRRPHGLARRRLDRRRRRLRRHARPRRVAARSPRGCPTSSTASASGSPGPQVLEVTVATHETRPTSWSTGDELDDQPPRRGRSSVQRRRAGQASDPADRARAARRSSRAAGSRSTSRTSADDAGRGRRGRARRGRRGARAGARGRPPPGGLASGDEPIRRLLPDVAETTVADQVAALDLVALAHAERPYVITNFALTLDGHATISGRSGRDRLGDRHRDAGRAADPRRRGDDRRRDDARRALRAGGRRSGQARAPRARGPLAGPADGRSSRRASTCPGTRRCSPRVTGEVLIATASEASRPRPRRR